MARLKVNGKLLNELWEVDAKHALYRRDGKWYHNLKQFPGVLFDENGYIVFETEEDYLSCPYLQIKSDLHVPDGIKSIPGYIKITTEYNIQDFSQQIRERSQDEFGKETKISSSKEPKIITLPKASDIAPPDKPDRVLSQTNRIIRDTRIAKWVKYAHNYKCQICGASVRLQKGKQYAEAHHLKPLGNPHNGPDILENIVCVCPNHHAQLDYGAIKIKRAELRSIPGHHIGDEYIDYHNDVIVQE